MGTAPPGENPTGTIKAPCPQRSGKWLHSGAGRRGWGHSFLTITSLGVSLVPLQGCPAFWHLWATLEEELSGPHRKYTATSNHKKSHNVLSTFAILCWAAFIAILSCIQPVGCGSDTPAGILELTSQL